MLCPLQPEFYFVDNSINLPSNILQKKFEYFVDLLCNKAFDIPNNSQYVMMITPNDRYLYQNTANLITRYEPKSELYFNAVAIAELTKDEYQYNIGLAFAQGINIPGISISVDKTTTGSQSFLGGNTISSRNSSNNVQIGMLETNSSYTDSVLRPWITAISYLGTVPRKNLDLRCRIEVFQFKKGDIGKTHSLRKITTFFNALPIQISEETLDYEQENQFLRQTEWQYSSMIVRNL